jgi:succinyl-CoA synthetase beta subunit
MSTSPLDALNAARAAGRSALDEIAGKRLLAHFGIAVPRSVVVAPEEATAPKLTGLRPPFVVKVMSPDILHKSDAGGVRVRLQDAAEVDAAMRAMRANPAIAKARLDGFLVEEMAPPGEELVVGGFTDPQFGPLVMAGLGGIFVEVMQDVAFRICPIERIDAIEMLADLKASALLDGVRGRSPVSRDAVIDVLLRIGGADGLLVRLQDDIVEADINPVIVSQAGAVAVDARFILKP